MTISKETIKAVIDEITKNRAVTHIFFSDLFWMDKPSDFEMMFNLTISEKTILALERESGFELRLSSPTLKDKEWELFLEWSDKHGLVLTGQIPMSDAEKERAGMSYIDVYNLEFVIDARTGVIISTLDIAEI